MPVSVVPVFPSVIFASAMPKQHTYTVAFKIRAVQFLRANGDNVRQTAREFNVDPKRIREWRNSYSKLVCKSRGEDKNRRSLHLGKAPFSEELDAAVYEFFEVERSEGRAVSNKALSEAALKIAAAKGFQNFKASDGWLRNWKRRFNVSLRQGTNSSQFVPADYKEKLIAFRCAVKELRLRHDYTLYNIGNMDQTMVRYECPPRRTNSVKGQRTVRISTAGAEKKGCTVALCATASGHKRPAYVIFKEANGVLGERVRKGLKIPPNVKVDASVNGWMNAERLHAWASRVWGPNVDDVRRLLTLDNYRPHLTADTEEVFSELDTDLVHIPAGCTSIAQPMDVCVNKPFKAKMRELYVEWRRLAERTVKGRLPVPSRQQVLDWVSCAWDSVSEELIKLSFLRCGISNAVDGSEEHEVRKDVPLLENDEVSPEDAVGIDFTSDDEDEDFLGWNDDGISVYNSDV